MAQSASTAAPSPLGVGLWTMQSTAGSPIHLGVAYRDFLAAARRADALGLHAIWTAQHRAWYDGWCPAPLHALALAAGVTERVRLATSVVTLPQQDPVAFARSAAALDRLSGGRLDLGAGLGHRDAEYDQMGLPRTRRGRLMDTALEALRAEGVRAPVWIGGMSAAALDRAARTGANLILPQSLTPQELAALVAAFRERGGTGRIGAMRDVWVTSDAASATRFRLALDRHYREEIGAWWMLKGDIGFRAPTEVGRQIDRVQRCAVVGDVPHVAAELSSLLAAGADVLAARVMFDFTPATAVAAQLEALAADVAPALEAVTTP